MLAFLSNGITDIQRPDYIHHFVHEKYKISKAIHL